MSATVRYIRKRALSPVVTGSLLYILTRGPEPLRRPLINILSTPANVERAKSVLKWLLALGLLGRVNSWLNSWAENGWQLYGDKKRWNWNKEIAVITGGSNGIGAGVVKGLAAKGIKCVCDITSPSAVSEVASEIRSKFGNPTILINNAGIGTSHTILSTEPEYLQRLFSINVFAHYNTLQAFLPSMISANKGHIITVASLSSFVPPVGLVHYASTKAAVMSLHEGLTSELRHLYNAPNVKTSIVHPTYARTRLLQGFEKEVKENKGVVIDPKLISDAIVRQVLSGRGARVVVPQGMSLAKAIRGMPSWLQERLRDSLAPHTESAKNLLLKR
ncbi:MAG: hypothetical protein Q9165_005117 [Trypethelium subeluteriae]